MAIHLNTIGIVVDNMKNSLDFYRLLGLTIPDDVNKDEWNVDYQLPNGIILGFISKEMARNADPNRLESKSHQIILQFSVDSPQEVNQTYNRMIEAGYTSYEAPWDAFWGQRFAQLIDPDGNKVNLFAHMSVR